MDLLQGDSESEVEFTINRDYADKYEKWRRGEEIQKLKDKYGDVEDSVSSTSDEEEDENAKELTEDVEKQFFKTLSCLKEKNPKIYDQNVRFFEKKAEAIEIQEKKKEPSLTLAGYQRKVLLETGGKLNEKEDEEKSFEMKSCEDQENDIKQSFKDILCDSENEDGNEWGNMFTKRVKTAEELEKEEEDYRLWLIGEKDKFEDKNMKEELKGLHDYWTDPKLDDGEKYLRDYILNKRYLDNEEKDRIPSYDEIVHDSDSNLSADEKMIDKQDEFERKYNFRFEEPDREFIKRYPRTLEQSMRKKDERRKIHRDELKQRKQAERSKKDEELKRLKALKKKEIMEKIQKLQRITGNEDISFRTEDLEGDFDPETHDKRMSQIFNKDYYDTGGDEEEKPEFPDYDEELEIENWDNWEGYHEEENNELHCEDPGFNMDCDYDPTKKKQFQKELVQSTRRQKKRKKSKFAESLEKEKPVFDPKEKTFEEYIDEYYALDYEDLIGDIPCRFKYRKVVPNDFGLSIEEILNASDQELNRWVSLKKITRRTPEHVELYDVKAYRRKAANFNKKAKCFPSIYGSTEKDQEEPQSIFKNGQEMKKSEVFNETRSEIASLNESSIAKRPKKKKNKKKISESGSEKQGHMTGSNMSSMSEWSESTAPKLKESERVKQNKNFDSIYVNVGNDMNEVRKKKSKNNWFVEDCVDEKDVVNLQHGNIKRKAKKRKHSPNEKSLQQGKVKENKSFKKHKFNNQKEEEDLCNISDARLRSYGLNPKKYKNKLKYKNKNK